MEEQLKRGRRRSADSILMAIKAIVLKKEVELRRQEEENRIYYPDQLDLLSDIKLAFRVGGNAIGKYWEKKVTEIEKESRNDNRN